MTEFVKIGGEFEVNPETGDHEFGATTTVLADGSYVLTWTLRYAGTGGATEQIVMAQRYDPSGARLGDAFEVNQAPPGILQSATSAAFAGGFVVTWQDAGNVYDGSGGGIKARLFDTQGNALGDEFRVNAAFETGLFNPAVVSLATGGFAITWEAQSTLRAQVFDASGARTGQEVTAAVGSAGWYPTSEAAALAGGGFVLAWKSGHDVYARIFNDAAAPIGAEFRLNAATAATEYGPNVTALADGGFLALWEGGGQAGAEDIRGQRFDASGARIGGEFVVNQQTAGDQSSAQAVGLADGGFLVSWTTSDTTQDGSGTAIKARQYGADGQPIGDEFLLNTVTGNNQGGADLAVLADGRVLATWTNSTGGWDSSYELHAQFLYTSPNAAPQITSAGGGAGASFTIAENDTAVTVVAAADTDGPLPVSYWIGGGADAALFTIDKTTGALRFVAGPDFESPTDAGENGVYELIVEARDGLSVDTQTISVTVTDLADGLSFYRTSLSALENGLAGATLLASGGDGAPRTYTIVGGADGALFTLDAATGALGFVAEQDFEAPGDADGDGVYEVEVTAADGTHTVTRTISVELANVNEGQVFASPAEWTVVENEFEFVVGTVVANDIDGDVLEYFVTGGADGGLFSIGPDGTFGFDELPDFEAPADADGDNVYEVEITAFDGDIFTTQLLTITVADGEDPVPPSFARTAFEVSEIVWFSAALELAGDSGVVSYSIVGGDDAWLFHIDTYSGELTTQLPAFDYEAPYDSDGDNTYEIEVHAYDSSSGLAVTDTVTVTVRDAVNEDLFFVTGPEWVATEHQTYVGTVLAYDAQYDWLSYAIVGGADGALFTIAPYSGELNFLFAPDFAYPGDADGDNVYEVELAVSDGWSTEYQLITIAPPGADTGSPFVQSELETPENAFANLFLEVEGQAGEYVTFEVTGGADAALFWLDWSTGQLELQPFDFEAPQDADGDNVYEVEITATHDSGEVTGTIRFTVTDVDEPLAFSSSAAWNVYENQTSAAVVQAADPDGGGAISYFLTGGADAARFVIDQQTGELNFVAAPDYEAPADVGGDNVYHVEVMATDGQNSAYQNLQIGILNVIEGFTFDATTFSAPENTTAVGTVHASGGAGVTSYSIVGGADASRFTLNASSGVLTFKTPQNYEAPGDVGANRVYEVEVRAVNGALSTQETISVTLTNQNEAPVLNNFSTYTVTENSTAVTTLNATDPDGQAVSYSISGGVDAQFFQVNAATGALSFIAAPDFETRADSGANNVYNVTVRASDGSLSTTQSLAITVADGPPVITSNGGETYVQVHIDEGATAVTTVVANEPDGRPVTYAIVGGFDSALFAIDAATGALRFLTAPDFEAPTDAFASNVYAVTVSASNGSLSDTQSIFVYVDDVPDVSITSPAAVAMAENGTAVATVTAVAPGGPVTFAIAGGADAARFAIDSATGALSFVSAPDFEAPADSDGDNAYEVVVSAGNGSLSGTKAMTVTVTDANEAPVITSAASIAVSEFDTAVTTVSAADPEGGVSYAIAGGADAALFAIDAGTGALSFIAAPDFEAPGDADGDNVYEVVVSANDGSLSDTQTLAVTVGNVNEGLSITSPAAVTVGENRTAVTTVTATDIDGDAVTFAIAGGADAARFAIDSATGALSFVSAPDFESGPGDADGDNLYEVTVSASDGNLVATQALTVELGNVDEYARFGAELTVNSTYARTQAHADVARLANGSFVVTWIDADFNTTAGRYVRAQVYEADGTAVGGELTLASDVNGAIQPSVAGLVDGGFVAAWSQMASVAVQLFDDVGSPTGAMFTIPGIDANLPDIAALPNGGFAITYRGQRPGGADPSDDGVYLRAYDANGVATSDEVLVNTSTTGEQDYPSITAFAGGGCVVSWYDRPQAAFKIQVFDAAANKVGGEVHVGAGFSETAQVIALADGGFAVASYVPSYEPGAGHRIQIFTAAGTPTGEAIVVPTHLSGAAVTCEIAALSDGNIAVAWLGSWGPTTDGSGRGVFVQVFDRNGQPQGDPIQANTQANGDQLDPSIAALDDGAFVVSWVDLNGAGADDDEVKAQVFARSDTIAPLAIVSGGGGETAALAIVENGLEVAAIAASGGFGRIGYAITGGADAALFAIDAATGALSFVVAPDFEAPADADGDNVYEVVVSASDGTRSDTQAVAVTVANANEAVAITSGAAFTVDENSLVVATVTAVDLDGTAPGYSITGGADAALFAIDAVTGVLSFVAAPDFEAPADAGGDNVYDIVVSAGDGSLTANQAITVTVADVGEAPVILATPDSLNENHTFVGNISASDPDGDALTYSIVGGADGDLFTVDFQGELSFRVAPDFEVPGDADGDGAYEVTVGVSDGTTTTTATIAVTVSNLNEQPSIAGGTSASFTVGENATAVATIAAADPEGGVTYSIGSTGDAALFTIDTATGELRFTAAPDFEMPGDVDGDNVYQLTVWASDGALSDFQQLTITVAGVNETPAITSNGGGASATVAIGENGIAVTTVSASDPEGGVSYAIVGGADAALFVIDALTGALSFLAAPDFEASADADGDSVYDVVVRASDGSLSDTQALSVSVSNANEAPLIVSDGGGTSAALELDEGGTAVTTVTAADPDGDSAITYAITGGPDAALFAIDTATGALSFVTAPDFEAPADQAGDNFCTVVVTASDGELTASQAISVLIRNVNEGLSITASATAAVVENITAVTVVSAVDIDGDAVTYAIASGADAARFVIDAATGALSFATAPNFETPADAGANNVYDVVVSASDGSLVDTHALAVTVGNVNEAPVIASGGGGNAAAYVVNENATAVATVAAGDAEGAVTYSLAGGADAARFTINASTGVLSLVAALDADAPVDFDGDNVYEVNVSASDGSLADTQALSVTVGNLVDGLTISGNQQANTLNGDYEEDTISGLGGNDTLRGLAGADTLNGGDGADRLIGGAGADILTGGAKADVFEFEALGDSTVTASDLIVGFSRSQGDRIELTDIDANANLAGNQAFSFIGSAAFSNVAGQLRYFQQGVGTFVEGDVNGDGQADFQVIVDPLLNLVAGDFIL